MIDHPRVRGALRSRLLTVEGISKTNVAFENSSFKPTTGVMYVRETMLYGGENKVATGQLGAFGIYQLDFFAPFGKKTEAAEKLRKRVGDAFEPAQSVVLGDITVALDRAEPLPGFESSPWYIFPLQIRWRSYTSTPTR